MEETKNVQTEERKAEMFDLDNTAPEGEVAESPEKPTVKERIFAWVKRHKKALIIGTIAVVGTVATAVMGKKSECDYDSDEDDTSEPYEDDTSEPYDKGRDCIATIATEDTGEVVGTFRCTEGFARDVCDETPEEENEEKGD